jgi:hypothetical protein
MEEILPCECVYAQCMVVALATAEFRQEKSSSFLELTMIKSTKFLFLSSGLVGEVWVSFDRPGGSWTIIPSLIDGLIVVEVIAAVLLLVSHLKISEKSELTEEEKISRQNLIT